MTPRSLRLDVTLHDLQLRNWIGFHDPSIAYAEMRTRNFDVIQG